MIAATSSERKGRTYTVYMIHSPSLTLYMYSVITHIKYYGGMMGGQTYGRPLFFHELYIYWYTNVGMGTQNTQP